MRKLWAYDVEVLPNFFSITIVDLNDYLKTFEDCNDGSKKKKSIPLIQKLSVKEIKSRLSKIKQYKFWISDFNDNMLLEMLGFINNLQPRFINEEKTKAIRNDMFGYNNGGYDKLMVAALLMYYNNTNNTKELIYKLYEVSKHIISMQNNKDLARNDYLLNELKNYSLPYTDIDVMTIFALNKCGKGIDKDGNTIYFPKSLKQTSINLQWYELLEHELPPISNIDAHLYYKIPKFKGIDIDGLNRLIGKWDRLMIPEWVDDVIHYNTNDVFIVCEMIRLYRDEIASRYSISKSFKVDVLSASRSRIGDVIFEKLYSDNSGLQPYQWKGKKTERNRFSLKKIIFPFINFKTKPLQDLLEEMKTITIYSIGKSAFERVVRLGDLDYTIATGGLHSKDTPRKLISIIKGKTDNYIDEKGNLIWENLTNDSYVYIHYDITSFYPSIMIAYEIHPEHLDKVAFRNTVSYCKDTRVRAKHSEEELIDGIPKNVLALVLKIVINSIYGKFGYEFGELFDRLCTLQVTINGQLMIMMLCEELTLNGIEVVSANTDGIVVKLPAIKKKDFDRITKNWETITKMKADSEEYRRYVCRDINNYAAEEINKKVDSKGDYNPMMYAADLTKGYNAPIVSKAAYDYLLYDIPILDTLYQATNILDFCKTQNVGKDWICIYTDNNGTKIIQRNNRYYVSTTGGTIEKVEKDQSNVDCFVQEDGSISNASGRRGNLCAGQKVQILNTLDDTDIAFRNISYDYYYNEVMKLIDPIVLGIAVNQKADNSRGIKSGKSLIKKYSGLSKTLFDDAD